MIRNTIHIAFIAFVLACAPTALPRQGVPAGHESSEEAAVLAAMDRYMTAISASDHRAMAAMQTPEGMSYRGLATEDGGMAITARPNSHWADPARDDGHVVRERYWSPTVLIRGGIAIVWAPYEFWIDGKTSHCGVDVIDFVNINGQWLVSNSMWTVEPNACAELRTGGTATLRPAEAVSSN